MKVKIKNVAEKKYHALRPNNIMISPALEAVAVKMSADRGGNRNGRVSISHGLQCMCIDEARRRGLDYTLIYKA
jgi:hypothetical protein